MKGRIVAVDFDGTCVDHRYPDVGPTAPGVVEALREMVASGDRIILWTMRSGAKLADAVKWFETIDIPLFGVNQNPDQKEWTDSPKAYAQVYIDDAALGCPTIEIPGFKRACVDWRRVSELIHEREAVA